MKKQIIDKTRETIMSSRSQILSWRCILGYFLVEVLASPHAVWADVSGGIITDGTMGASLGMNGINVTVPQDLGTTIGNNLFHSFSEFNIATGQTVEFTGSDALQNVISRVTGSDVSEINGTLSSSIANAAFYFINPNGITFGAGAHVDVPGAFHVSTADKIDFPNNGGAFYADSNQTSTLSTEAPAAFGFLGTSSANNGLIDVNNAQLEVKTGQALDIVTGGISVENQSLLAAPAGEIRMVAIQGEGAASLEQNANGTLPLPTAIPSAENAGRIAIDASATDTIGDGGGRLALWGGNTSFTNSTAYNDNIGASDATSAKGVDIRSYTLNVDNSWITFDTESVGKAGKVSLFAADTMTIDKGGHIKSSVYHWGNAGNVVLKAGTLNIFNGGNVASSTYVQGNAGHVSVIADTLTIDSQGYLSGATGIVSRANPGSTGQAGDISVETRKLDIVNGGRVSTSTFAQGDAGNVKVTADSLKIDSQDYTAGVTGIYSKAELYSSGHAGNVSVQTNKLDIVNIGDISSSTDVDTQGDAGNVSIKTGSLAILKGGAISSYTAAEGSAGNVEVIAADALTINGQDDLSTATGIYSRANQTSSGQGGNVNVQADALAIVNGGNISSSTFAQGDAGNVTVTANNLKIDGQGNSSHATGINSQANQGDGNAGAVDIRTKTLDIVNGGVVSSSTFAQGDAGKINVITDNLTIDSQGNSVSVTGIVSRANRGSSGQAGNVNVRALSFDIVNGGVVSSSTFAQGDAGKINVIADNLTIDSQGNSSSVTGIVSRANHGSSGQAGNVNVRALSFDIVNGGNVSSSTFAQGGAGSISIIADALAINGLGNLSVLTGIFSEAKSGSSGQVGNIIVQAFNSIKLSDGGEISIENDGDAIDPASVAPSSITLSAPDIILKDSSITTNSTGNVDAGNVTVNFSHWLTLDPSFIRTTANTGNGGTIDIDGGELIFLQNSGFITTVKGADSESNGGDIFVTADTLLEDTGIIQANAVDGSGGNITLSVKALIPSSNTLILGGPPVNWQAYIPGFNLIQAASEAGINGTVSVTAPQLNLSGIIANLGAPQFDSNIISQDFCGLDVGSSLTRKGAGGLKPKSGDQVLF
ncbi:MAG: filamentous hemagglutinin N-terminal domain-containing protein [Methylobacter sp.]|nr:MAG: filamentous hemagglutinin N-terminal domain-containing protein [Methylobacter sp.]